MTMSNKDRIRKGLDQIKIGFPPFVVREPKAKLSSHAQLPFLMKQPSS